MDPNFEVEKCLRSMVEVGEDGVVEIELQSKSSTESSRDPEMSALLAEVATLQKRVATLEASNGITDVVDVTETTMDTSRSTLGMGSRRASKNASTIFSSLFGLATEGEEETDQVTKSEGSDSSREPETNALKTEVNALRVDMAMFQKRMSKLETRNNASRSLSMPDINKTAMDASAPEAGGTKSTGVASLFGSLFRLTEEEEEETDQQLHEDTYSFIMVSQLRSYSFVLGMLVFFIQQIVFLLMLWSLTGYDPDGNPKSGNLFGVPVNVDPQVRLAQMVALGFIVITQTDVIKGLDLVRLISNDSFHKAVPHIQTWRIVLCIVTNLLEGSIGIIVSFMLIVTSENIVFLLLNFTAMAFVSELDEAVFFVTRFGFFGVSCEEDATTVKNITYKVCKKSHRKREIRMLVVMFVALVAGWGVVVYNQNQGVYQCSTIFVQFGDDILPALGTFSGMYDLQKPERQGVLNSQYMIYVERRSGRASFAYCHGLEAWTFMWHEEGEAGNDPCDSSWVAMSTKTLSYDITTTASKTWYAQDKHSRVVVLDPFYLACYDCGRKEEDCNGRGSCHGGVCECKDGSFGLRCEFLDPCPSLAKDARTAGFIGTRPWSDYFERLYIDASATDVIEAVGLVPVEAYHRPVYINEFKTGRFDLLFFTGRRWVVTYSDFILGDNSTLGGDRENPRLALARYFLEDFHGHWSQFTVAFVSEPVDVATPSDANSPLDLKFYQAVAKTSSEQIEIQGVDGLESDVRLLCAICDNETNPCAYDGQCKNGTCFCPMSTGSLCEIPPVGNGFCNPYFNSPEFNYDGGDCCPQTCQSDAEYDCGMDPSGYGSIGYYFCKEFSSGEWILSQMSWEDYNVVGLSDDGQFLVVSSPWQGKALMFDKIGKDWVQRGPVVDVPHLLQGTHSGRDVAITSLAPMMVHSHEVRPPYLVLFPDIRHSKLNFVLCENTCKLKEDLNLGDSFSSDVVYAISSGNPFLALRTTTNQHGKQRVSIYLLHDGRPSLLTKLADGLVHISSISLSASGNTLAVQSSKDPLGQPPPYEVHIYDLDGASGRYKERNSTLHFYGVHPGKMQTGKKQHSNPPSSPLVISSDGTTIAFSAASGLPGNKSSTIQVYVWDDDLKNWTSSGQFSSSGNQNHNHIGYNEVSGLSSNGRTLLLTDGTKVSVVEREGRSWGMVGKAVSSLIKASGQPKSVAMSRDGSVVAMGIGEDGEVQSAHVLSISNQKCPDDMSLLRASVTTDKQPDTKSWTLVANESGEVLFQSNSNAAMQYWHYQSATYAHQSCIKKDSCHVLSLYAHGLDDFQSPGGYHLTLDGVNVGSEQFGSDSFNVARRVFVGNCLSCESGMRLLRFLLTTCETTASWELVDTVGEQVFSGNSSRLENDFGSKRLCAERRQNGMKSYVVPAPYWEEICIDPKECYSLKVSAPSPQSTRVENMTRYYIFEDSRTNSEQESFLQDNPQKSIELHEWRMFGEDITLMESTTRIGNCAPTSEPSTSPTLSASPTAPTASPSASPSGAPTKYHISVDDPEWPGEYPTNTTNNITFNICSDNYPEEIKWKMHMRVDTHWSLVDEKGLRDDQAEIVVSQSYSLQDDTVYKLEISDTANDGTCCNYGRNGWFTVTSGAPSHNNPEGTVVWEILGDKITSVYNLYLEIDTEGHPASFGPEIATVKDHYSLDELVTITYRNPAREPYWIAVYPASIDPNYLDAWSWEDWSWACGSQGWPEPNCSPEFSGTVELEEIGEGEWIAFATTDLYEPYKPFAQSSVFSVGSLPVEDTAVASKLTMQPTYEETLVPGFDLSHNNSHNNSLFTAAPTKHPAYEVLETTSDSIINNSALEVTMQPTYEETVAHSPDYTTLPQEVPTMQPSSRGILETTSDSTLNNSQTQAALLTVQPTYEDTLVPTSDSTNSNSFLQTAPTMRPTSKVILEAASTYNHSLL